MGLRLNLSTIKSHEISQNKEVYVKNKKFDISDLGLEIITRDIGTGYHIPEGVFIGNGDLTDELYKKNIQNIDTCKIAPTILNHFNISIPNYMQKNI